MAQVFFDQDGKSNEKPSPHSHYSKRLSNALALTSGVVTFSVFMLFDTGFSARKNDLRDCINWAALFVRDWLSCRTGIRLQARGELQIQLLCSIKRSKHSPAPPLS